MKNILNSCYLILLEFEHSIKKKVMKSKIGLFLLFAGTVIAGCGSTQNSTDKAADSTMMDTTMRQTAPVDTTMRDTMQKDTMKKDTMLR